MELEEQLLGLDAKDNETDEGKEYLMSRIEEIDRPENGWHRRHEVLRKIEQKAIEYSALQRFYQVHLCSLCYVCN